MHLLECYCGNDASYKLYSYNDANEKGYTDIKEYVCSTCASYMKNDASTSENAFILPINNIVIKRYRRKLHNACKV